MNHPKLIHAAPLTFWICVGYVWVNLLFGAGLFSFHPTVPFIIVGKHIFTLLWWGFIFFFLALMGALSLVLNKWKFIRIVLLLGLVIKALWFYALIIRTTNGGALVTLAMWTFLAYTQFLTVIFFPEEKYGK